MRETRPRRRPVQAKGAQVERYLMPRQQNRAGGFAFGSARTKGTGCVVAARRVRHARRDQARSATSPIPPPPLLPATGPARHTIRVEEQAGFLGEDRVPEDGPTAGGAGVARRTRQVGGNRLSSRPANAARRVTPQREAGGQPARAACPPNMCGLAIWLTSCPCRREAKSKMRFDDRPRADRAAPRPHHDVAPRSGWRPRARGEIVQKTAVWPKRRARGHLAEHPDARSRSISEGPRDGSPRSV